jgi:hypothetical protein
MPTDQLHPIEPSRQRRELARLLHQIQVLRVEVDELRQQASAGAELEQKHRTLEQLRWRLANLARRAATDELGNAA